MHERARTLRILTGHFFRRFFDNDTVQLEGDTQTTVVRALAAVSAPGLIIGFWLGVLYPSRGMWGGLIVCCYFVTYSIVAAGLIAVVEWEMLFPDKLDFLVLTPLPLRPMEMFAGKGIALAGFLGLFLFAANVFSSLLVGAAILSGQGRPLAAHLAATLGGGMFAVLLFLAIGGVMLCVLSARMFRIASPLLQMFAVMALTLLLFAYLRFGGEIVPLLQQQPLGAARWLPPVWFLGLFEVILQGRNAPAFAPVMARYALLGLASTAAVVALTYPLAWARVRRMTIEGVARPRVRRAMVLDRFASRVLGRPGERAVFRFIGQTMARNNRYQVYLAVYCGVGLALAVSSAVAVTAGGMRLGVSEYGLHAVMPMLAFWTIAGLRTAFAFPVNLQAGWIFRVTGVDLRECAAAARRWAAVCAGCVLGAVLAAQALAGWSGQKLLVQAVCGVCLCLLLSDVFFFAQRSVPFNQPRMPGKVSFPLVLTLYVGVYPQFVLGMGDLERWLEKDVVRLAMVCFAAAALHIAAAALRGLRTEVEDDAEFDGEFQLLGLTTQ